MSKGTQMRKRSKFATGAASIVVSIALAMTPLAVAYAGGPPMQAAANGGPSMQEATAGGPSMQATTTVAWSGANTITSAKTTKNKVYKSTQADQNALLVNTSSTVQLKQPTVRKTGGTSASDAYSFYGINSGVLCKGGGTTVIRGGTVRTNAAGANGVFAYGANNGTTNATGDGTTVKLYNTKIVTKKQGSGGIMTTFGGTTIAKNLTVVTSGGSSAPIRTDRGGGLVKVTNGKYTSKGVGSPAIYSTADVRVTGAKLISKASEGTVIEGTGSIALTNCKLTANNTKLNGNAQFKDSVMIYQSMSGDASSGSSKFTMTGGEITSKQGHVFHVTNTNAKISLSGVSIVNKDSENVLLSVCDDGWSGGSNVTALTATDQTLTGKVLVDSNSRLTMKLKGSTIFKGRTSGNITNAKGAEVSSKLGTVKMSIGSGSTWVLTGDSKVSSLSGLGKIKYNGHTLTVGSKTYSSGSIGNISEA